ncbi:MAG: DUF4123 domain-containing protein [Deltaproteobacteria bacterium]|nr:DUF4123 domain-containing protein [Deltaproteobacteria bacterium]
MASPHVDKVIRRLWRSSVGEGTAQVYVILDAARNKQIYAALLGLKGEFCCLYRGEMAERLAHVAPYLVKLQEDNAFTKQVLDSGWGDNWGIFLNAPASLRDLRNHFRRFLVVYDESAKSLYFRYYDPRVLQAFLPTCNTEQLLKFFGPVDSYLVESDRGDRLIEYFLTDKKLIQEETVLTET